jgi:hypothetical protein
MTGRVQSLRSNVAGNRPTGRQPGELYVNWPDSQLGVINSTGGAQDLIAITFYTTGASYAVGQYVVQGGLLYRCVVANAPGAFNPAQWAQIGGSVGVGDTAPTTPQPGTLWWDSVGGQLYVWFVDANSSQWVIANNAAGLLASGYLALSGGTMTGPITLPGNPTAPLQTVPKQYVDALPVAMNDNRIINGDMRIDQRNGGASGTAQGYTVDRWVYISTQTSKGTWGQVSSPVLGFPYCLGFTSSSTYTPVAADSFQFRTSLEGDAISDFGWGTANAQPVTLSFWAKSTLTGTFSGSIRDYAPTRSYPFTFSLPTANTWTKFAITIPGDTSGAWVLSGNAGALMLTFELGGGATYRGPANAWAATGNYAGATGAVSIAATNAANFQVTGVKLEIGSVATSFNRQSLAKSMADCLRYYQVVFGIAGGYNLGGSQIYNSLSYQFMRAVPSVTFVNIAYTNASGLGLGYSLNNSLYAVATITGTGAGTVTYFAILDAEL